MNFLNPIFIAILIFGIYTSYTDIKHGKIKNFSIILLLISGLFINIFLTKTFSTFDLNMKSDFIQSIVNIVIAFSFGFFLWLAGLWSSGDAKLFLGYSLLLPVFTYHYGYISFFPSIVILINTFIPVAIFYISNSVFHLKLKDLKESAKEIFSSKNLQSTILFIFGFFYILQLFLKYFHITLDFFVQMFILFILMEILNKISSKATLIFSIIGSLLKLLFSFSSIFTISFLFGFLYSLIIFLSLSFVLSSAEFYSDLVKIKNLKVGMMLGEQLIKTKRGVEKKEISYVSIFSIIQSVKQGFLGDVKTRLTEEDIKELQKLQKEKKLEFSEIKIAKTVPFAPFMFFGVLITYFLQGNLLYYLSIILNLLH
jgi:Flp pilus assembly protein protease CpaA